MGAIREYFLQIVAVCMIAAICNSIVKNQLIARVIRLVSGILILLVVIAPLAKVDIASLSDVFGETTQVDKDAYHTAFCEQVQAATQEHIERIAQEYGVCVKTEVTVSDDEVPIPVGITIIGSPNVQQFSQLSDYIESQLGIPKEEQVWRRVNG